MKTIKLSLIMLLSFFLFNGCSNENGKELGMLSKIEIKAMPTVKQTILVTPNSVTNVNSETKTVFTSDEIVSYNAKTGELILKGTSTNQTPLSTLRDFSDKLEFYKDGKLLFMLKSKIVLDIESVLYNEPVLQYSSIEGNKCFIRDGYPWGLPIGDTDTERIGQSATVAKERGANAEKILAGWNIFIDELKRQEKYIDK